jgi:UTP:GlnB (protein PII) uridylyltransferase
MAADGSGTALDGTAPDEVERFASSMPDTYREAFADDAREHAAIVARRGSRSAHLERWRAFEDGTSIVCVVADDRAGLLSTICRVFVAHDLDVVTAQVHCRKRQGLPPEAFDLFWLRKRRGAGGGELSEAALEALAGAVDAAVARNGQSTLPPGLAGPMGTFGQAPPPRVYFNTNALRKGEVVLIVEALDCPGLLLAISLALHREGLEITASTVRTEGRIALDSFVLRGPAGKPMSSDRLAAIRQAVVEAVRKRLIETEATL